jgi:hypothetical protein
LKRKRDAIENRHHSLVLLFTAIRGFAQDVSIDYDKGYDFSKLRTYALKSGATTANPLMDQRIERAIDNQLSMKGYKKVDSDPDMLVIYYASTGIDINFRSWGSGPPWAYSGLSIERSRWGTVVLDMVDAGERSCSFGHRSDGERMKNEKDQQGRGEAFRSSPATGSLTPPTAAQVAQERAGSKATRGRSGERFSAR